MTRVATPLSTLVTSPETAQAIAAASDCFEAREHGLERITRYGLRVELLHSDLQLIAPWTEPQRDALRRHLEQLDRPLDLLSFHVAACYADPRLANRMYHANGPRLSEADMLANAEANRAFLTKLLPTARVAIENNNYYPTEAYQTVTDPAFLGSLVGRLDLRFLLDLAHAQVAAHNRGVPLAGYLAALPLNRLAQIHLSGHTIDAGTAFDTHTPPEDGAWALLRELVRQHRPDYLTIEYYQTLDRLLLLLARARKELHELS